MSKISNKKVKCIGLTLGTWGIIILLIIISPIWGPIYVLIKTIVTIWQPYFKRQCYLEWHKEVNRIAKKMGKKYIYADYPPTVGTFCGIGPWNRKKYDFDYDDDLLD